MDVQELLDSCNAQLEPTCLDQALEIAAKNGHYKNAGWLILKGALNIDKALHVAKSKSQSIEMYGHLLLMKAAMKNDFRIIAQLFSKPKSQSTSSSTLSQSLQLLTDGKISTIFPIEIAKQMGHTAVMEELLLRTRVTKITVDWSGLQLKKLESNFLIRIAGVKQLDLSMNGLKTVPLLADFQQVLCSFACSCTIKCIYIVYCMHFTGQCTTVYIITWKRKYTSLSQALLFYLHPKYNIHVLLYISVLAHTDKILLRHVFYSMHFIM